MKIIVTGCAGFIGSKVAEILLDRGDIVYGIDNIDSAYDKSLKLWRLARLESKKNFIFNRLDITDGEGTRRFFLHNFKNSAEKPSAGADALINLAALAGVRKSLQEPQLYYNTNLIGVLNLLDMCREFNVSKLVQASTSSVYGNNALPFSEDQITDCQLSPYAASKKAAELLCYTYHINYGIDVTVLRYFTVYGPGGRPDMSPFRFIRWITEGDKVIVYGDGKQLRDFTYIDDIASGTLAGLKELGYEIINLGSSDPVELNELISTISQFSGKEPDILYQPFNKADMKATCADISKAERLIAWKPEYSLQKGVEKSVRWYNENRNWVRKIAL